MNIYYGVLIFVGLLVNGYAANSSSQLNVLKTKVNILEKYMSSASTYCTLHANGRCGSCLCKDDFNLPKKFYCDCQNLPAQRDCLDFRRSGYNINGIYKVTMNNLQTTQVFCDQTTSGGGWTVIQRRMDGSTNFYRNWQKYKIGFGQLHREFWLGNENIYLLTLHANYPKGSEAWIEFKIFNSVTYSNRYSHFQVDNEKSKYMLHVSGYSGGYGPSYFTSYNNNQEFSTYDRDNDKSSSSYNCAKDYNYGGWWYNGGSNTCTSSQAYTNLNGPYDKYHTRSWYKAFTWGTVYLEYSEIKVRRLI